MTQLWLKSIKACGSQSQLLSVLQQTDNRQKLKGKKKRKREKRKKERKKERKKKEGRNKGRKQKEIYVFLNDFSM